MARVLVLIILGQFAAIVGLLLSLSREYQSNVFMQLWVGSNAWFLGYLLNGYFAAALVGILVAVVAYVVAGGERAMRLGKRRRVDDVNK